MKDKALLLCLAILLTGAAGCTVNAPRAIGPAARVEQPRPPVVPTPKPAKVRPQVPKKAPPGTATYPIDSGRNNIKVEPTYPPLKAESLLPPFDNQQAPAPAASLPAFTVEDARVPSGTSPAVVALLTEADRNQAAGDLGAAVVATERALRIDSRNPVLTYKLAQLRIKQHKPQLAEELAGKASLLAGGNLELKRKSWLLIAEARRMQNNYQGAKEAKAKAESFFGR